MKEVMEKEETDPFYSSLYGGFYDEENDADYKCKAKIVPVNSTKSVSEEGSDTDNETGSEEEESSAGEEEGAGSSADLLCDDKTVQDAGENSRLPDKSGENTDLPDKTEDQSDRTEANGNQKTVAGEEPDERTESLKRVVDSGESSPKRLKTES